MSFWGSFAAGAGNAAGSNIVDLLTAGFSSRNQNAINRNLQRQALGIQENQFAASLQHDADMADMNANLQAWLMRVQDDLNSPERMVQKLLKAGISPSVFFGNGGNPLGNISSQSVHGSSVPASASIPGGSQMAVAWPSQFGDVVAKTLSAIGGYRLNSAEADKIRSLLPSMVEKGIVDVQMVKEAVEGARLENYVKNNVKDVRVQHEVQSWLNEQQDYYLKVISGEKMNSELEFQKLLNLGQDIANRSNDFQLKYLLTQQFLNMKQTYRNLVQQESVGRSQVSLNNAMSENYAARTLTENELRQWSVMQSQFDALISKSNHTVLNGTELQRMREIVNRAVASDLLPEQMKEQLRGAVKSNDWYEVKQIIGIAGTAIEGYSSVRGAQYQKGIVNSWDVRNRINEEYNSWLQDNDVNETVVYQQDRNGRVKSQQHTYTRRRSSRR